MEAQTEITHREVRVPLTPAQEKSLTIEIGGITQQIAGIEAAKATYTKECAAKISKLKERQTEISSDAQKGSHVVMRPCVEVRDYNLGKVAYVDAEWDVVHETRDMEPDERKRPELPGTRAVPKPREKAPKPELHVVPDAPPKADAEVQPAWVGVRFAESDWMARAPEVRARLESLLADACGASGIAPSGFRIANGLTECGPVIRSPERKKLLEALEGLHLSPATFPMSAPPPREVVASAKRGDVVDRPFETNPARATRGTTESGIKDAGGETFQTGGEGPYTTESKPAEGFDHAAKAPEAETAVPKRQARAPRTKGDGKGGAK